MDNSEWIRLKHRICDLEAGLKVAVSVLRGLGPHSTIANDVKELSDKLEELYMSD